MRIIKIILLFVIAIFFILLAFFLFQPLIYKFAVNAYYFVANPIKEYTCVKNGGSYSSCNYKNYHVNDVGCGCKFYDNFDTSELIPMKPVIYLYPKKIMDVSVTVNHKPGFLVTYPEYDNGWDVIAFPNGKIINKSDGKEYNYLFWEGNHNPNLEFDLSLGFVVRGSDTADFLQKVLSEIGLTPAEYNEFIVYWYPKMVQNPYNLVHFASDSEYAKKITLDVTPKPDSILRVFMVYKPLKKPIEIIPQEFVSFKREGFSVVEWGGSELK